MNHEYQLWATSLRGPLAKWAALLRLLAHEVGWYLQFVEWCTNQGLII